MANENLNSYRPSTEELVAAKKAAREEKQSRIKEAIKNGARINYANTILTEDEKETIINIESDNTVIIDTTIPKDITKCLKGNWEIIGITYNRKFIKDEDCFAGLLGVTFKGSRNNIIIRTCKE